MARLTRKDRQIDIQIDGPICPIDSSFADLKTRPKRKKKVIFSFVTLVAAR